MLLFTLLLEQIINGFTLFIRFIIPKQGKNNECHGFISGSKYATPEIIVIHEMQLYIIYINWITIHLYETAMNMGW